MVTMFEHWAPFLARVIFAVQFGMSAFFKVAMHDLQVAQTAAAGVPFPDIAVWAAFVVEVLAAIALLVGFKTRAAAFVLVLYVLLITVVFYRNVVDPMTFGAVVSHLGLVAGLIYVSVYGAQHVAVKKDAPTS